MEIGETARAVPEPAEPAEDAGSGHDVPAGKDTQQGSSLEKTSLAERTEEASGPDGAVTVQENSSRAASQSADAAVHSDSVIVSAEEQLNSFQHDRANSQQVPVIARHSQESMSGSAVLPEPKQTLSIFQRYTAALTGESRPTDPASPMRL